MADTFLNQTGLGYYHNRLKTLFGAKADLDALAARVDGMTIPEATSDLTNDGDGESPFATQEYVAENGGKIDVIQVNGTAQTITNKTVNIPVPTDNSQLANGAGYQDATDVDGLIDTALANGSDPYTTTSAAQALIDDALADITSFDFQVVQELPATGEKGIIYLVPKTGTAGDSYDEWIWVTPTGGTAYFEKIGSADVDLSGYWSKTELTAITTAQIDALFA